MPRCPHCGDPGAPAKGWCLACGLRVDTAPTAAPGTETLSFDDLEPTTPPAPAVLPSVAPLALDPAAPLVMPTPVVQPVPVVEPIGLPAVPTLEPVTFEPEPAAPVPIGTATRPHCTVSLRARYEFSAVPGDDPPLLGVLVELSASGTPLRRGVAGPVAHVVLALDVSASMNAPDKFPVLRDAIDQMLRDLRAPGAARVHLSVVIFGRGAAVVLRDAPAPKVIPAQLFAAIEGHPLCFTNYTDVAGALDLAGRIAYDQTKADRTLPVRIYLLTDGRPQDVARATESARRCARVACDLHALAFGADADVRILQELFAGGRGGTVKSVRRATLTDAFERIAEVAQQVVATTCRVATDLAPGVVGGGAFRYRPARVRFPEPAFAAGKRFRADLGTIESDRVYSLLFEIRPPETDGPATDLGTVTVRIPSFGGPVETTLRMVLPRTPTGTPRGEEDRDVRAARDILDALDDSDPAAALRALQLRRQLYEQERRDPGLLAILERAIEMLEKHGTLAGLTPGEHATLLAHTCTSGSDRPGGKINRRG